jgi:hypothetical protein
MPTTIFYSWQSDTPNNCNRGFIRDALSQATQAAPEGANLEDSPRVDDGMRGIAGTPEVATIMFQKICSAAIFVGDMTLVGSIAKHDGVRKSTPNPNVLLEMGFAAGKIGWGRIICVMNEEFGVREDLPFDVRNRRFPINYRLGPNASPDEKRHSKDGLARELAVAINTVSESEHAAEEEAVASLDVNCLNVLGEYGGQDSFAAPDPAKTIVGGPLDTAKFGSAVLRLLDLRLIQSKVDQRQGLYAYHWTYIGKRVLMRLQIRR